MDDWLWKVTENISISPNKSISSVASHKEGKIRECLTDLLPIISLCWICAKAIYMPSCFMNKGIYCDQFLFSSVLFSFLGSCFRSAFSFI
nr:hypothetical protein Q903MT_gene5934 [Picea sitchensis]